MRATVIYGAGDVRVETAPDPVIQRSADALVRVVRACTCGSDLWPYGAMSGSSTGQRIGHEFPGVIEDTGSGVEGLARGGIDGGQGEAVRVPQAQGTLVKLPAAADPALLPSPLTLADVFAAKRLGAEQIILMGRHADRTDLGVEFGAADVVPERGQEGIERVRDLTGGDGTHTVLECAGLAPAIEAALAVIDELLPDVLDGRLQPGRVFDRTVDLDGVPDGYRAMADRKALKVLITP